MKYLIIGAGGIGGPLAFNMAKNGKDVCLLARKETLSAVRDNGLIIEKNNERQSVFINVQDEDSYKEAPDVIFLCVKAYSVDSLLPFMKRVAGKNTVIIPLLNVFTTGEYVQEKIPQCTVTDGCIYIAANIKEPGVIEMHGDIIKVVFGRRDAEADERLNEVAKDLRESGISVNLSKHIKRDALRKFSYVSPAASCGLYYDCKADKMQKEGEERELFIKLMNEIRQLSVKMGCDIGEGTISVNLSILDKLSPTAGTSLQLDMKKGGKTEIDGLIHSVTRISKEYGLILPTYEKVSEKFGSFH